ncbi:hypothetical protein [Evansella halocellulosilytica]|uniref:hypothetical protein n=1 Tax=Evansella halocellulosilytica TaxID=2011013 RepID=UPI000BB6A9EA|nr:hypothetical protein [Evansella halocellulosilytica]
MAIYKRHFQIEDEECLIHLPTRPNGFAIFILGDRQHFVKNGTSYWQQNFERHSLLNMLLDEGYTIFYSNQQGIHWGNDQSTLLSERAIQHVLKTEILNPSIHVFAEGMGALIAMKLLKRGYLNLRSAIFINPCLHLFRQYEEEKSNKFFYKKFIQEMTKAYEIDDNKVEDVLLVQKDIYEQCCGNIPLRMYQVIYQAPYTPEAHIRPFIEEKKNKFQSLDTTFYMPGKTIDQFLQSFLKFLKKHETFTNLK